VFKGVHDGDDCGNEDIHNDDKVDSNINGGCVEKTNDIDKKLGNKTDEKVRNYSSSLLRICRYSLESPETSIENKDRYMN
jgi:hypothetical protein